MGNRAVLVFENDRTDKSPAIYLHWNGGRDSIEPFLTAAKLIGIGKLTTTTERMDAIATMLAKFFFECEIGRTVYREPFGQTDQDNMDNGVYLIDNELSIVGRLYHDGDEQSGHDHDQIVNEILSNMAQSAGIYSIPEDIAEQA